MNRDTLEGNWRQIRGEIKRRWGRLTDDDLAEIAGRREVLLGKLQELYGLARETAERELEKLRDFTVDADSAARK